MEEEVAFEIEEGEELGSEDSYIYAEDQGVTSVSKGASMDLMASGIYASDRRREPVTSRRASSYAEISCDAQRGARP